MIETLSKACGVKKAGKGPSRKHPGGTTMSRKPSKTKRSCTKHGSDQSFQSRSQEFKKSLISQSVQSIWMEFCKLLRLVSIMNLVLISSRQYKREITLLM